MSGQRGTVIGSVRTVSDSDSECGTVRDSDSGCGAVLDNAL